ncbi:aldehyde dehydrogenase family protein [Veillonella magna]|uniref:aldehyde dehydrogenase family protein n=1 Tax=Veillonella magna TaxID=464322 RepID=UPI0026DC26E8|nr:aldehyde dehydrogenase family protein [Veillonella magna]
MRWARHIRTGNVFINDGPRDVEAPFGGFKSSGIGREGGRDGLLEFTEPQALFDNGH